MEKKDETSLRSLLPMHTSHRPPPGDKSPPGPSDLSPLCSSPLASFFALFTPWCNAQPCWAELWGYTHHFPGRETPLRSAQPKEDPEQWDLNPKGCCRRWGLTSPALSYAPRAATLSLVVMLITRSKACKYFNRSAGNSLDQNKRKALYTEDMRGLQPT